MSEDWTRVQEELQELLKEKERVKHGAKSTL